MEHEQLTPHPVKVGYLVKRYPCYSETFVVNELLAHEAASLELDLFALYPPTGGHFQDAISRVRAPVTYLSADGLRAADLWRALTEAGAQVPDLWQRLAHARNEEGRTVYQAAVMATLARQRGIAHLHAHFANQATGVARLAAGLAGITYSFTAHAKDIFHETVKPDDLRRKLADASAVVTVSDYNLRFLRERYGDAARRVVRVYNGLDLELYRYSSPRVRPPRIVSVGRLVEKKGLGDLVAACSLLARQGSRFECDIIGAGPLQGELEAQIAALGLVGRVRLLGPLPQVEVIEHLKRSAVFAGTYVVGTDGDRDGLPTVLVEAMALGTPVVATDVTAVPEVVRNGVTGLLVPQGHVPAIALAVDRLLVDASLRSALAERARERVERDFNVRINALNVRRLFPAREPESVSRRLEIAS